MTKEPHDAKTQEQGAILPPTQVADSSINGRDIYLGVYNYAVGACQEIGVCIALPASVDQQVMIQITNFVSRNAIGWHASVEQMVSLEQFSALLAMRYETLRPALV